MSAAILVVIALVFLEGSLLVLAPALVKRLIETVPERTLQIAGLLEAVLALALLLLIYI